MSQYLTFLRYYDFNKTWVSQDILFLNQNNKNKTDNDIHHQYIICGIKATLSFIQRSYIFSKFLVHVIVP